MIGFPEEAALILRDFELESFNGGSGGGSGVSAATLICGGVASNIRCGTFGEALSALLPFTHICPGSRYKNIF